MSQLGFSPGGIPPAIEILGLASQNAPPPLVWEGANDNGQVVGGGVYYLRLESRDPFGSVQVFVQPLNLIAAPGEATLTVYNGAGELVKTLRLPSQAIDFQARSQADGVGLSIYKAGGGMEDLVWDGRGDSGKALDQGSYLMKLEWSEAGMRRVVKTENVTLLLAPESTATAALQQAKAAWKGGSLEIYLPGQGLEPWAGIYNLAGERVASAQGFASPALLRLDAQACAAGIYLIVIEVKDSEGRMGRKALKAALLR